MPRCQKLQKNKHKTSRRRMHDNARNDISTISGPCIVNVRVMHPRDLGHLSRRLSNTQIRLCRTSIIRGPYIDNVWAIHRQCMGHTLLMSRRYIEASRPYINNVLPPPHPHISPMHRYCLAHTPRRLGHTSIMSRPRNM